MNADRAVDSTPIEDEIPSSTICVTPNQRSCRSSSVPVNGPQCRLLIAMSSPPGPRSFGNSANSVGGACVRPDCGGPAHRQATAVVRPGHPHAYDRQALGAEGVGEPHGILQHVAGWVHGGQSQDAVLEVYEDEGGALIQGEAGGPRRRRA